ncbi:MAG: phosphate ABC transporter permease PstA [Thermoleophilia bacterium]|jgi:phosphate transport system permease protein|nr:phosphate ABC transporter permease PstA [Thermoleophilia bacterium]
MKAPGTTQNGAGPATAPLKALRPRSHGRRKAVDAAIRVFAWVSATAGIAVMFLIVWEVLQRGFSAIDWGFFTELPPVVGEDGGGLGNAILGTLVITFVAALIALPMGFFGGIWLAEFGRNGKIATGVRMVANVNMGIPSIVVGVFIFAALVRPLQHYSGFAGSIALAFIMLPVMARTTEDILNLVPNELRESGLAMGAPRWRVTLGVVIRAARSGLITGAVLATVRVAGETAPLLFTALSSPYWLQGLFGPEGFFGGPTANLTKTVYDFSGMPYERMQELAWGGALVIIAAVLGLNVLMRLIFQRGKEW